MDKLFKIVVVASLFIAIVMPFGYSSVSAGQYVAVNFSAPTSATVSQQFAVNVVLDTSTKQVSAVELHINFPADKLQALSIVKGDFLSDVLQNGAIGAGTASITIGSGTTPKTGIGTIAVITFKALTAGVATLSFADTTQVAAVGFSSNVLEQKISSNITLSGGAATPTATLTSTPTTTFTATPTSTQTFTFTPTATRTTTPTIVPPISQVQTGPGDTTIVAILLATSLTLLYAGYTRSSVFYRHDAKNISKEHNPLDFRN